MFKVLAVVLTMACSLAQLACARCPYESQCEGNVLHTCWLGVDQMFGDPATGEAPCAAPNPVCVNLDESHAQCTMTGAADCDDGLVPACADGVVVSCASGYRVAEDCAGHGNGCFVVEDAARCALDPLTTCDPEAFVTHCAEQRLITCSGGYESARDCALWSAGSSCEEHSSDAGQSAYCS